MEKKVEEGDRTSLNETELTYDQIKREIVSNNDDNGECSEPKKAKNASYVWQHFTKLDRFSAKCNTCNRTLKIPGGSTSSLDRHFSSKHGLKKSEPTAG